MNDDFDVENDHLMIGQNEIALNCLWNVFRGEIGQKSETKPDHKIAVVDMESVARKALCLLWTNHVDGDGDYDHDFHDCDYLDYDLDDVCQAWVL